MAGWLASGTNPLLQQWFNIEREKEMDDMRSIMEEIISQLDSLGGIMDEYNQ